jgi:hypothetical protein
MPDAHANFARSTVATAPSPASSGTSLVVAAGEGAKFPAVPFNATVWPTGVDPLTTNAEIVRVTNISTDTLTITRTQESSSARTIVVGDNIAQTITKKTLEDYAPLTTKGDIYGYDTALTRVPAGTNGYPLQADSGQTPGVGYATTTFDFNSKSLQNLGNTAIGQVVDTAYDVRSNLAETVTSGALRYGFGLTGTKTWTTADVARSGQSVVIAPSNTSTVANLNGSRTVSDAVTNSSATVTSATAAFTAADVGHKVTGTNIPANSYVGVRNSATSIGLSSSPSTNTPVNASGSGSGGSLTISSQLYVRSTTGFTGLSAYADTTTGVTTLTYTATGSDSTGAYLNGVTATAVTGGTFYAGSMIEDTGLHSPVGPAGLHIDPIWHTEGMNVNAIYGAFVRGGLGWGNAGTGTIDNAVGVYARPTPEGSNQPINNLIGIWSVIGSAANATQATGLLLTTNQSEGGTVSGTAWALHIRGYNSTTLGGTIYNIGAEDNNPSYLAGSLRLGGTGAVTANNTFEINDSMTYTSAAVTLGCARITPTRTVATNSGNYGVYAMQVSPTFSTSVNMTGTTLQTHGAFSIKSDMALNGSATYTQAHGVLSRLLVGSGATLTTGYIVRAALGSTAGTITTLYGVHVDMGGFATTTGVGVKVTGMGGASTAWGIQVDTSVPSYMGSLVLGATSQNANASMLDVAGAICTRRFDDASITSAATYNNVSFNTGSNSFVKLNAISGAVTITGITNGVDGLHLWIYNPSANNVTLAHESASSTAANRIRTNTGSNVATTGEGTFHLIYDTGQSRWILDSTLV